MDEAPKKKLTERDYQGTHDIVCPYCGYEIGDSWELDSESEDNRLCDECENRFSWQRVVDVTYDSYPAKEDEETGE